LFIVSICKIIPPSDFQPPFSLNINKFEFSTRSQRIDQLQVRDRDFKENQFLSGLSFYWNTVRKTKKLIPKAISKFRQNQKKNINEQIENKANIKSTKDNTTNKNKKKQKTETNSTIDSPTKSTNLDISSTNPVSLSPNPTSPSTCSSVKRKRRSELTLLHVDRKEYHEGGNKEIK
jgi:hypothetical protein